MHIGCSIGLALGRRAGHRVLAHVEPYSRGVTIGEAAICFGTTSRSLMAVPRDGEDGMSARPSRLWHTPSGRLVWTRGTMA